MSAPQYVNPLDEKSCVVCPFCGEGDFDLIGLKTHFERGWCEAYDGTPRR